MKRIYTCVTILIFIAAFSALSIFIIKKSNDTLFELIDQAQYIYQSGGDASDKVEEIEDYWEKYYIRVSYISNTSSLDDIASSVSRLHDLLGQDSEEFLSELNSIRSWTEILYNSQFPHLYSVF